MATVIAASSLLFPCAAVLAASHCPSAAPGCAVLPAEDPSLPPGATVATRESTLSTCFLSVEGSRSGLDPGMDYAYVRHEYDGVAGRDRDLHRLQFPLTLRRPRPAARAIDPGWQSRYSAAMSDPARKALLIDLDGLIYEGGRAVDGAVESVRWICDVGGAQEAGIGGVLVRTGKYRGEESTDDVRPAAVLDSVADLPDWWRGH